MLLFKKKFLEAIVRDEKSQTIRLWRHRKMRPGQRSYIPGVGYILILSVDEVALAELTDAQPDGFPTAEALRREIEQLYAEQLVSGASRAFRVRFRVLDDQEQTTAVAERRARRQAK